MFVETRCYSEEKGTYVRSADSDELDASLMLGALFGYGDARSDRWAGTIEAVRRELAHGPFVRRYTGEDGLAGSEGAFLPCSFWLAESLARTGRVTQAVELMDELADLSNDVGLYAEEIDPTSWGIPGELPAGAQPSRAHQCRSGHLRGAAPVTVWAAIAGGFVGTLVLTTTLRAANELGLTRMDLPFLLGTAFTTDRIHAKAFGYVLHFLAGLVFAVVYYLMFLVLGHSGWALGAAFGLVHGLFSGTALVSTLLPLVHPHMGTPATAATSVALLEPPGFMMLNYGPQTPLVSLAAHVVYGALIGGFVASAG